MIRLRGHHLVCLRFFRGQGYDPGFQAKVLEVLRRAGQEETEVVAGPDEVCSACPYRRGEECTHPETSEAEIREMDRAALKILGLTVGSRLRWPRDLRELPEAGFQGWFADYCRECSWRAVCETAPEFQALLKGALGGRKPGP